MYERVWTVRFSDADMFGIAFYPQIVDAIHETSDMFMEEIGYPYWAIAGDGEGNSSADGDGDVDAVAFGFPLVEFNVEFERPVEAGDEVTIELTPDIGTRSLRFDFVGRRDGAVTFRSYEQRACVAKGADSAMEIPDDVRAALQEYAEE